MFGRYIRASFLAIFSIVGFAMLVASPAHAIFESYEWTDYKTISAKSGIYGTINGAPSGSDSAPSEFVQDPANPTKYILESPGNQCTGKLILTIDPATDNKATLASEGDCPIFQGADANIASINARDTAMQSVENEQTELFKSHTDKECGNVQNVDKESCEKTAEQAQKDAATACKTEHDYSQTVTKGEGYLACIAEKLGVDRSGESGSDADGETITCSMPDSGWVICPIVEVLAFVSDKAFDLLVPFLLIDPLTTEVKSGTESTTYSAWAQMRNIANVIFVVIFLVIIWSQLTNIGISVYGIKKTFPKLIVAAMLMNMSFFLSSVAIDISNVVGKSLQGVLVEMSKIEPAPSEFHNWTQVSRQIISTTPTDESGTNAAMQNGRDEGEPANPADESQIGGPPEEAAGEDDALAGPATQIVVGGVTLYGMSVMFAQMAALIPIMVAALFSMLTVLIVLLFRQAIVIMLVVIAPIAIALYVLPNTKKWFDKWTSIFFDMLVMFPAIAVIFGGSHLASQVIRRAAEENGQVLLTIFALGIQVIPLFVSAMLIKVGGSLLQQFGGIMNDKQRGVYDRSMNAAKGYADSRRNLKYARAANGTTLFGKIDLKKSRGKVGSRVAGAAHRYRGANRQAVRDKKYQLASDNAEFLTTSYLNQSEVAEQNLNKVLGKIDEASQDALREILGGESINALERLELEQTNAAEIHFRNGGFSAEDIISMGTSGQHKDGKKLSEAERRAAIRMAGEYMKNLSETDANGNVIDGIDYAHQLVAASGSMSVNERRDLMTTLRTSGATSRAAHLGGASLGKIERGEINNMDDVHKLMDSAAKGGKFSQNALATQSDSTLRMLSERLNGGHIEAQAAGRLRIDADQTLNNRNLSSGMGDRAKQHLGGMR